MEQVDKIVGAQDFDFICLVNNASLVEPLGSIENCPAEEIEAHIHTGLISPMVLTSLFIRRFRDQKTPKKIAFISSGSSPMPFKHLLQLQSRDHDVCSMRRA